MAKTLQERIATAKSPRARVVDNEALLLDLAAEVERLTLSRDAASDQSTDFALSDEDRDQAAAKSARLDRTIKALEIQIAEVAHATECRRNADAREAAAAECAAALAERDAIAAKFAERVPALTAELIELFKLVNANEARMRRAGVSEANAELHARCIPPHGHIQMMPAPQFTKMTIPGFDCLPLAWPISA